MFEPSSERHLFSSFSSNARRDGSDEQTARRDCDTQVTLQTQPRWDVGLLFAQDTRRDLDNQVTNARRDMQVTNAIRDMQRVTGLRETERERERERGSERKR